MTMINIPYRLLAGLHKKQRSWTTREINIPSRATKLTADVGRPQTMGFSKMLDTDRG